MATDHSTFPAAMGVEPTTPATIANRPGLPALAYRAGTHGSFYAAMQARLAGVFVDAPFDEVDEHGMRRQGVDRLYPLRGLRQRRLEPVEGSDAAAGAQAMALEQVRRGLTTRASDDPALALLDGWATVADVLTFYQERIANEGYLRTATERRSVLELARLLGYAPRPGVASTVYLAYTIDDNFKETALIDIGARSQSVPGPGELPQSFETVEKLTARAAWNLLQPRMSQPQVLANVLENGVIYLKGIAANLKTNDALLVRGSQAGISEPRLMRVVQATISPQADRTKVRVAAWEAAFVQPDAQAVATIAQHYKTPAALAEYKVNAATGMARDVLASLEELSQRLAREVQPATLHAALKDTLTSIKAELTSATTNNFVNLKRWLSDILADLEQVAARRGATTAGAVQGQRQDPLRTVMTGLTQPPSLPPANALRLRRDLGTVFGARGDAGLQVVNALQPELRGALATALGNVQATPANDLEVYALRLKTGVYGSSAPPKPVLDGGGRAIATEDWPLNPDSFGVHLISADPIHAGNDQAALRALIQVKLGGRTYSWQTPLPTDPIHLADDIDVEVDFFVSDAKTIRFSFRYGQTEHAIALTVIADHPLAILSERSAEPLDAKLFAGQSSSQVTGQRKLTTAYEINEDRQADTRWFMVSVEDEAYSPAVPQNVVSLDGVYDQIAPGSWVAIPGRSNHELPVVTQVTNAQAVGRSSFNFPAKVTALTLGANWLENDRWLDDIRDAVVLAQSEQLELAEEPIEVPICGGDQWIELGGITSDLQAGRWVIVASEREDVKDATGASVPGLRSAELVMLAEVRHGVEGGRAEPALAADPGDDGKDSPARPGDRNHTFIKFAQPLEYCYRRDQIAIYGNVVKATHGETRPESLGSGNGSKAFQSFPLRQPPLTFVSAPTAAGAASTLKVYVNNIQWQEADALAGLLPGDRRFITRSDDDGKTTVVFGDGRQGARLPTGSENVRAEYRNGIGQPGNVQAEQISLLLTRPLGVRGVINPLRASGGADRESRDQARKNAPLAVMALDRLVAVQDYADFARTFAGVAKAVATRITNGRRELVHVTIAGADDSPIDRTSDLYRNLLKALHDLGDPALPVQVASRERLLLALQANVSIRPDRTWEVVVEAMRRRLLDAFSFERRELGQDVLLSEVISVLQAVPGVSYVDVDTLGGIPEKLADDSGARRLLTPDEISAAVQDLLKDELRPQSRVVVSLAAPEKGAIQPAQIAFFSRAVPDSLILNPIG